jgi:hypothetical protein
MRIKRQSKGLVNAERAAAKASYLVRSLNRTITLPRWQRGRSAASRKEPSRSTDRIRAFLIVGSCVTNPHSGFWFASPQSSSSRLRTARLGHLELLARQSAVDFHDAHSLLAAGGASKDLSLVPEVTEIVIGRAACWGRELSAIRAGRWSVICAKTTQSLLILHVSYPHSQHTRYSRIGPERGGGAPYLHALCSNISAQKALLRAAEIHAGSSGEWISPSVAELRATHDQPCTSRDTGVACCRR